MYSESIFGLAKAYERKQGEEVPVDLTSLLSELHYRGLSQEKTGAALRCLLYVHEGQDYASPGTGGVLTDDVLGAFELDVVQAASELFLEKSRAQGREVFTVRWGCENIAEDVEKKTWSLASRRWNAFARRLDERYLGFFLPVRGARGRVITDWQLSKELKWFSTEVPHQGQKILGMMDEISQAAGKLGLAFAFRAFGPEGVLGPRVLLHGRAFEALDSKKVIPPDGALLSMRLWRFFSEYDVYSTNFVALMRECGLTLDEVVNQVGAFFDLGLTSEYREGQYPPYFINLNRKEEFQAAVRALLLPMESWLSRGEPVQQAHPGVTTGQADASSTT